MLYNVIKASQSLTPERILIYCSLTPLTSTHVEQTVLRPVLLSLQKPGLLYRVCRLALLLWLLLLALLLLAFLLPLMDEGSSCSLSNNFARSFNIMLRYQGPPPT